MSMLQHIVKCGDRVVLDSSDGGRFTYSQRAGAFATVVGFNEIYRGRIGGGYRPGVYVDPSDAFVRFDDGNCVERADLSNFFLLDQNEFYRRWGELEAFEEAHPDDDGSAWWSNQHLVRSLPETRFYEDDIVRVKQLYDTSGRPLYHMLTGAYELENGLFDMSRLKVANIDYRRLSADSGRDEYSITVTGKYILENICNAYENPTPGLIEEFARMKWRFDVAEDNLELIERGLVWKFYHGEPINFSSLQEEAGFMRRIGRFDEVKNPVGQIYSWSQEEALNAIRLGYAHGMIVDGGVLTGKKKTRVIRFWDLDLGRRIATETLKGFGAVG